MDAHTHRDPIDAATLDAALTDDAAVEAAISDALAAVDFDLALEGGDVQVQPFEEAVRAALDGTDGEVLFDMEVQDAEFQRIAAVRTARDGERQLALVIMPQGDGPVRVEPVANSSNPLARIAESYAGLMEFQAAA